MHNSYCRFTRTRFFVASTHKSLFYTERTVYLSPMNYVYSKETVILDTYDLTTTIFSQTNNRYENFKQTLLQDTMLDRFWYIRFVSLKNICFYQRGWINSFHLLYTQKIPFRIKYIHFLDKLIHFWLSIIKLSKNLQNISCTGRPKDPFSFFG